ncbi:esterase [Massilia sp. Root351]|jgi:predicted alpha/beta superfamily hydrolase|uniref:alpha/beta hydrolase n=1 Tax=Massilia sp. Root351 TaxID=1736522 RepID=UPI0007106B12|nr:alpha/beta hydrolase-fold protein [Massilia sp. Root351]KQV91091.1 esterase [Massilia sp. Root351]
MMALRYLLGAALLIQPLAHARAEAQWATARMPQALERDIVSTNTGQRYRIFVSVPESAPPPGGHPVIYALDGNASFPALALMARTVERRSKVTGQAPPAVVGIGYASGEDYDQAARALDYTPPAPALPGAPGRPGAADAGKEGGAARFLDFINLELKPLVQQLAPLDQQRQALFGHSYGGLFVLHTLFTQPASFQTYIAASPSIWWRERYVLTGLAGLAQRSGGKPQLLITVGELEQAALPRASGAPAAGSAANAATERNKALMERRMVGEARQLAAALQAAQPAQPGQPGQPRALSRVRFIELPGENHGSAMFPALSRGLEFFLE